MAKQKRQKVNVKRTVITLMAVYVCCHLIYGGGSILNLKMQERDLEQQLEAAYAEKSSLQADLEYMNSEDAVEKIAREKLGLVKEDEILIQQIDTGAAQ